MTVDPLRDQLAANCDAPRDSVDWERADEAYRDYVEAKARGDLVGPQPWREDLLNALQIAECYGEGDGDPGQPFNSVARLIRHALGQLEGSPLRAPQED